MSCPVSTLSRTTRVPLPGRRKPRLCTIADVEVLKNTLDTDFIFAPKPPSRPKKQQVTRVDKNDEGIVYVEDEAVLLEAQLSVEASNVEKRAVSASDAKKDSELRVSSGGSGKTGRPSSAKRVRSAHGEGLHESKVRSILCIFR